MQNPYVDQTYIHLLESLEKRLIRLNDQHLPYFKFLYIKIECHYLVAEITKILTQQEGDGEQAQNH